MLWTIQRNYIKKNGVILLMTKIFLDFIEDMKTVSFVSGTYTYFIFKKNQ